MENFLRGSAKHTEGMETSTRSVRDLRINSGCADLHKYLEEGEPGSNLNGLLRHHDNDLLRADTFVKSGNLNTQLWKPV